ncbi:iron uptake porin [Alkalinema sp. FACHB-956]|uniref:iron uptake porin n=1 Tax=Alkalinema sp. FACHB-956 TaxID=2692768 RepID=UPI00168220C1|nr:iron uptake porin [Alkalinema sp. FACHB-956]MBD2329244.1 carbohydrate porin [Alkalinema sp. FACHB-956]
MTTSLGLSLLITTLSTVLSTVLSTALSVVVSDSFAIASDKIASDKIASDKIVSGKPESALPSSLPPSGQAPQDSDSLKADSSRIPQTQPPQSLLSALTNADSIGGPGDGTLGNEGLGQVTSVSQLSDVKPTDWAFQALQSLVERYGVIAGYPDRTYRGNRALTRYEFAAGLNATLDRINELLSATTKDLVRKEDLVTLQKLQEEFAAELSTLRGRIDKLEAKTATLEKQQFSTTTKLRGSATFLVGDTFGDRANNTPAKDTSDQTNTFAAYDVRLDLQTSFTGKDLLNTGFRATNVPEPGIANLAGTQMTRSSFDGSGSFGDNAFYLARLYYRFPVGDKLTVWVGPRALQPAVSVPTLNPLVGGANGATSRFAIFNHTVYRPGFDGAGAALAYQLNPQLRLNFSYIADGTQANSPEQGRGLFGSNNFVLGQITYSPSKALDVAFTYSRKYFGSNTGFNLTGGTGSTFARNPFEQNATVSDNFGLQFNWRTSPTFQLGGWFGYTQAHQVRGRSNDATIVHGAVFLAFPDLFAKGNLGGFIIGVPPKVTSNEYRPRAGAARRQDVDTSLHLEAFYTFRVTNGVTVTPSVYVITNPEHNAANDAIWVGALRTNFSF